MPQHREVGFSLRTGLQFRNKNPRQKPTTQNYTCCYVQLKYRQQLCMENVFNPFRAGEIVNAVTSDKALNNF